MKSARVVFTFNIILTPFGNSTNGFNVSSKLYFSGDVGKLLVVYAPKMGVVSNKYGDSMYSKFNHLMDDDDSPVYGKHIEDDETQAFGDFPFGESDLEFNINPKTQITTPDDDDDNTKCKGDGI